MTDYKYDLALSLLDEDEATAQELYRLLPGDLSVFLYSARQLELVGDDGVDAFSAVFAREARTVAVLHRRGWGGTRWTAIEEGAVKSRFWNEGADFVTLVKLDAAPSPDWFPATRVWGSFDRLGLSGVAAVLGERIQARGRAVREETAEELAARVRREQDAEVRRRAFLASDDGVKEANITASTLFDEFERLAPGVDAAATRTDTREFMLYRDGHAVTISWAVRWSNTLNDSELCVKEWHGRPNVGGRFFGEKQELEMHLFDFDQPAPGEAAWRDRKSGQLFSSRQLAEWAAKLLLRRVRPGPR